MDGVNEVERTVLGENICEVASICKRGSVLYSAPHKTETTSCVFSEVSFALPCLVGASSELRFWVAFLMFLVLELHVLPAYLLTPLVT